MKRFVLFPVSLLLLLSMSNTTPAQNNLWQHSTGWTIYNIRGAKFYKIPLDSIGNYRNMRLNDDSMRVFLSQSVEISRDSTPMWMGAYVTTCFIDHKKRKIDISSYGGFFFDEGSKKFFALSPNKQKGWLNYLATCSGALSAQ
jgi:hypothetical protein